MKTVNTIIKIVTALAAVAGVIYLIATYGDKIVAWAKKLLDSCPCKCNCDIEDCADCDCQADCPCAEADGDDEIEVEIEEAPVEDAPVEEASVKDAPAEDVVIEEGEPVAEEEDFAE